MRDDLGDALDEEKPCEAILGVREHLGERGGSEMCQVFSTPESTWHISVSQS